jgi:iron-sulfur cluster repair protein YtfE (RIC family)
MKEAETFSSLGKQHVHLDHLFRKHQRALLERDLNAATSALAKFEAELRQHIEYEEHRLLPLYADKGGEVSGGTLEIFQAEHRRLREGVADLTQQSKLLEASADLVGSILEVLDEEYIFKGLFHHHVLREQNILFPRLDELSTPEERKIWLCAE